MDIYLSMPQVNGNRIGFSWSPNRLFKENSYWIEYPDFKEIDCYEPLLAEMYLPVCIGFAALGDVTFHMPARIDEEILATWHKIITNMSKKLYKTRLNLRLINGPNCKKAPCENENKGEKVAVLFGGGMESLTVLGRMSKQNKDVCLVSLGGKGWYGCEPEKNKAKFEMDKQISNDLGVKLVSIRTNLADIIDSKAWYPLIKFRLHIFVAGMFLPFNILSINPIAQKLAIGKVVSGNEKENDYSPHVYCFSSAVTKMLKRISSCILYESLFNNMWKTEVAREFYETNKPLVKYQCSCQSSKLGQRWCHVCEKCFRYYLFFKLHNVDLQSLGFDEKVLLRQLNDIIWKVRYKMRYSYLMREYRMIYKKAKRLKNKQALNLLKKIYRFYLLRKIYYCLTSPKIKYLLYSIVLDFYIVFRRASRMLSFPKKPPSALLLPPWVEGSLGDEAIVSGAVSCLREKGIKKVGIITYGRDCAWASLKDTVATINLENYLRWGSWKEKFRFVAKAHNYTYFYCLGADVMDGFYSEKNSRLKIELISLAARLGIKSSIIGFSINKNPELACINAFKKLPRSVRLCCRDAFSQERLASAMGRKVDLCADVAFLFNSQSEKSSSYHVIEWIKAQKSHGKVIVGINANATSFSSLKGSSRENIIKIYIALLSALFKKKHNIRFLFIPHDFRTNVGEIDLNRSILEGLPVNIKKFSKILIPPYGALEIKRVCSKLDFVLTGRLHLAIACLRSGIPAVAVSYQGKAEGVYSHFGLDELVISPNKMLDEESVTDFLLNLIDKRKILQKTIMSRLPEVSRLSQSNFACCEKVLT